MNKVKIFLLILLNKTDTFMKSNLTQVFIGSDIEANYILSILKENNIDCIIENILNQSITAGWASGSSYSSTIIRVNDIDADKSSALINEYMKSEFR